MEEKNLSSNTKQGAFSSLRALLNFAVEMEYVSSNPIKKIKNFRTSIIGKTKIDFYTAEEFQKYITMAKKLVEKETNEKHSLYEWNFYVFFNIAFYTGLRKGEIHGLQWRDINGNFLSVNNSIAQKCKGDDIESQPKNITSIRVLQMPMPLITILEEHRKRQTQLGFYGETNRVLGDERCLRDTSIDKKNRTFAQAASIKRIRVHDFRHSHASLLANAGINIQEIARRLGHSKIEITWNTYSHLYPREEERAVEILNKV